MKDWRIKIKDLIRSITKNSDDYDEKYMTLQFNSSHELSLNKIIEIVVRAISLEKNKYYPHIFWNECLYKLQIT